MVPVEFQLRCAGSFAKSKESTNLVGQSKGLRAFRQVLGGLIDEDQQLRSELRDLIDRVFPVLISSGSKLGDKLVPDFKRTAIMIGSQEHTGR